MIGTSAAYRQMANGIIIIIIIIIMASYSQFITLPVLAGRPGGLVVNLVYH